jgi:hypothetical protein
MTGTGKRWFVARALGDGTIRGVNRRRNFWTALGGVIFAATLVCRADTIQLSSGQEVKATVTKYRNHAFEVRTDDGKNATYPANNVKRI